MFVVLFFHEGKTGFLTKNEARKSELWFVFRDGSGDTGMSQWNYIGRQSGTAAAPLQSSQRHFLQNLKRRKKGEILLNQF